MREELWQDLDQVDSLSEGVEVIKEHRLVEARMRQPGKVLDRKEVYYGRNKDKLDYYIILVKLESKPWGEEYVTWWESPENGSRSSGHYFMDLSDARDDFENR